MVEINNQRKAFLDMLAWSRELITDVRKPEIMVMTSLWRRAIYWLLRSPANLSQTQNSNQAPDATSFFPLVGCLPRCWPEKDFPKKSDAVALQQIAMWRLPMIDRGDICQAITVAAISGASPPGAGYNSRSIRLTAWLQNSKKRAERSERLMYEQSHHDYLRSGYLHRSPVSGLLIITVITPLPTKPSAIKMPENCWRTRQLPTCRCVSVMLLRSMQKYTKAAGADAKAENDACVMMLPLVVVGCTSKQSVSQCAEATTASGADNAAWLADTAGINISPQRGRITTQKTTEGTQKLCCRAVDRVAAIDGQLMQLLWAIHTRFQRSINAWVIKPSNPFTNVCWVLF